MICTIYYYADTYYSFHSVPFIDNVYYTTKAKAKSVSKT